MFQKIAAAVLLCLVYTFMITSCGEDTTNNTGTVTTNDDTDNAQSSCLVSETDDAGCDTLTVGTYTFTLNTGRTQVKILKEDCSYCADTLDEDEFALTSGTSAWTCEYADDPATSGIEIKVTIGGVVYELDPDGQTLRQDESVWGKRSSTSYTCDGD